MKPKNKKNKNRWYLPPEHPLTYFGYVYNRNGKAYLNVGTTRVSTNMPFSIEAQRLIFKQLIELIQRKNSSKTTEINNISQAIEYYHNNNIYRNEKRKQYIKIAYKKLIKKDFHITDIENLRTHIITNIKLTLQSQSPSRKDKTYNPSTIKKYLNELDAIFKYLVSEGKINKNPINKEMLRIQTNEIKKLTFTINELNQIYDYFQNDISMLHLLKFLYLTGMRINEALNLKWSDINEKYINVLGKGKRFRVIPLEPFPELQELLTIIKQSAIAEKVFNFAYETIRHSLRLCLIKLNIYEDGKSFHSIRKTRENEMIRNEKYRIEDVAEMLGHSIEIQKRHYLQELSAEKLSENLSQKIGKQS